MGFILDEVMFIWSKEEDGSMVLKDETKKWILNIIKRGWKCRLTFTDGSKVVGIPTEFKNNIELTLRSADILDDEDKIIGTYSLEKVTIIETVENELSDSILRRKNMKFKTVVQSISDINKRDSFLNEINEIRAEFLKVNTSGKSFFGFEKMREKLKEVKGNKKLVDLSDIEIYENWYFNIESNSFIAITNEGEKEIKFADVLITD